jgi:hypothetical protein
MNLKKQANQVNGVKAHYNYSVYFYASVLSLCAAIYLCELTNHIYLVHAFFLTSDLGIFFHFDSGISRDLNSLLIYKTMIILWTCGVLVACLLEWYVRL